MQSAFTRTANAGGLLELDGQRILLDGVSGAVGDYLATPPELEARLLDSPLDGMLFTHDHPDHFQADFVRRYGRLRPLPPVLGPESVGRALPGAAVLDEPAEIGPIRVLPFPTRHMGDGKGIIPHRSFLLIGSCTVWFMGDASPGQWRQWLDLPRPDMLIAPFPYFSTAAARKAVEALSPKTAVLVHLPDNESISWTAPNICGIPFPAGMRGVIPATEESVILSCQNSV